jgi:hypothetical protein
LRRSPGTGRLRPFNNGIIVMTDATVWYLIAADTVLLLHVVFVAYVIFGLVSILAGKVLGWSWVRNRGFRIAHLVAIGVVVLQSWFGAICPLTILEMTLRARAGDATYSGTFIAHWLESALYYAAPAWVFALCYTLFGALVIASWFWVPPRKTMQRKNRES